jgi:hypothetical protein
MISLNAMRVGLLSRFMGVMGVIVGVAVAPILPIDQQGIIRVFWLAALGVLFLGRWRNTAGVGHRRGRAVADPAAAARGP